MDIQDILPCGIPKKKFHLQIDIYICAVLTGDSVAIGKGSKLVRLGKIMLFSWGIFQVYFAWQTAVA